MVVHTGRPSTHEVGAGGSEIQGHVCHSKHEASLGYLHDPLSLGEGKKMALQKNGRVEIQKHDSYVCVCVCVVCGVCMYVCSSACGSVCTCV